MIKVLDGNMIVFPKAEVYTYPDVEGIEEYNNIISDILNKFYKSKMNIGNFRVEYYEVPLMSNRQVQGVVIPLGVETIPMPLSSNGYYEPFTLAFGLTTGKGDIVSYIVNGLRMI